MEQTKTFAGLDAAAHASVRRLVNSAKSKREELDEARANKEPLAECQEDFEMEVKRLVKKVDALATSTPPKAVTPCADMFARDHDFRRQRRLALAAIEKLETDTHDSLAEASLQNSVEAMVKMIRDQCEVGPKVVDADDALAVWRPTPAMYGPPRYAPEMPPQAMLQGHLAGSHRSIESYATDSSNTAQWPLPEDEGVDMTERKLEDYAYFREVSDHYPTWQKPGCYVPRGGELHEVADMMYDQLRGEEENGSCGQGLEEMESEDGNSGEEYDHNPFVSQKPNDHEEEQQEKGHEAEEDQDMDDGES